MKAQVWSSGGGVQSTAIAALICQGKLPKPDLAVMADTGREYSPVWDYMREVVIPELEKVGVTMHIAGHDLSTVDLWTGKDKNTLIIPAFTDQSGEKGKLPKYCNAEWKVRVVQRFCRQHGIKDADQWIGYTTDEMERMRVYRESMPWQHVYPLIDLKMRRSDCLAMIEKLGWPSPPRSACWMCPFRSDQEWQMMIEECPSDFEKAKKLEAEVQQVDPHAYLHRSCKPIGEVGFTSEPDLFSKPCDSGGVLYMKTEYALIPTRTDKGWRWLERVEVRKVPTFYQPEPCHPLDRDPEPEWVEVTRYFCLRGRENSQ